MQAYLVGDPFAVGAASDITPRSRQLSAHRIVDAVPAAGDACALMAEARWSPSAVVRLICCRL